MSISFLTNFVPKPNPDRLVSFFRRLSVKLQKMADIFSSTQF